MKTLLRSCVLVLLFVAGFSIHADPLGTAFTYQGRLIDGGAAANGAYDLQFSLYDLPSAGSQTGGALIKENVPVVNGLFTVELDFGPGIFTGNALWLSMGVRPGSSTGTFATLPVRQALTPAPTSQYSLVAGTVLDGAITAGKIAAGAITTDKMPNFAVTVDKLASDAVITAKIQDNAVLATKIAGGQVVKSLNGLKDSVTLTTGPNVTLTTNGSTLGVGLSSPLWLVPNPNTAALNIDAVSTTTPIVSILNNSSSTAPPLISARNNGGDAPLGVLSVINYGTGLLAQFGNASGIKTTIATNGNVVTAGDVTAGGNLTVSNNITAGNVTASGNLDAKNLPSVQWSQAEVDFANRVTYASGDTKTVDDVSVLAQAPGYIVITAFMTGFGQTTTASAFQFDLYDVSDVNPVHLVHVHGPYEFSSSFISWVLTVDSPKYVNLRTTASYFGGVADSAFITSHNLTAVYIPKKSHE